MQSCGKALGATKSGKLFQVERHNRELLTVMPLAAYPKTYPLWDGSAEQRNGKLGSSGKGADAARLYGGFLRQCPSLTTHHMRIAWRRARSCATYSLLSEVPATLGVSALPPPARSLVIALEHANPPSPNTIAVTRSLVFVLFSCLMSLGSICGHALPALYRYRLNHSKTPFTHRLFAVYSYAE